MPAWVASARVLADVLEQLAPLAAVAPPRGVLEAIEVVGREWVHGGGGHVSAPV
jgi:hypothetical protein